MGNGLTLGIAKIAMIAKNAKIENQQSAGNSPKQNLLQTFPPMTQNLSHCQN
jgi:hypothetical protein